MDPRLGAAAGTRGALELLAVDAETFLATLFPNGELWKTPDAGMSWRQVISPGATFLLLRNSPAEPRTVYASHSTGFLRSVDAGDAWQPLTAPPLECGMLDLAVSAVPGPVLYAAGSDPAGGSTCSSITETRLFRSPDGGLSWQSVVADLPGMQAYAVTVDPGDPDTVYALTGSWILAGRGLWKSTDGGGSWERIEAAGREILTDLTATSTPGRLYAATERGKVYRTDDGGGSWSEWSEGLWATAIPRLLYRPGDPGQLFAATSHGVWVVADEP